MALLVLPGHDATLSVTSIPFGLYFLLWCWFFFICGQFFRCPLTLWFRPLLLQPTPANFHFFLIVAPAKRLRLLLGTLDKSVGGRSNGEHQRDVAWAGSAVTVILCEGYVFTSKPSGVGGSQSRLKRNWYHFKQPYHLVSAIYLFFNKSVHKPWGIFFFPTFKSVPLFSRTCFSDNVGLENKSSLEQPFSCSSKKHTSSEYLLCEINISYCKMCKDDAFTREPVEWKLSVSILFWTDKP